MLFLKCYEIQQCCECCKIFEQVVNFEFFGLQKYTEHRKHYKVERYGDLDGHWVAL